MEVSPEAVMSDPDTEAWRQAALDTDTQLSEANALISDLIARNDTLRLRVALAFLAGCAVGALAMWALAQVFVWLQ